MLRPLALAIALRYLRVRRRSRFVSVVAVVAVLGVALGVAALIVVLSVMNGMQDTLTERILGATAALTVARSDAGALGDPAALQARLAAARGVEAVAPYAQREVVLGYGTALAGVALRGIEPAAERRVSRLGDDMLVGSLAALGQKPYGIVLGRDVALDLGVVPGDRVTVLLPQGLMTPVGFLPRMRRFTVAGVFAVGNAQYDSGLALTDLGSAERLFGIAGPSGVRVRLADPLRAAQFAATLRPTLPAGLRITTWESQHQSLFSALANEQRMMFVLVALAVLIAAFNVLGVLTVLVADKRAEIAVLASLGMAPRGILATFLALGSLIGAFGIALGLLGGLLLAFNVNTLVVAAGRLAGHPLFAAGGVELAGLPSRVAAGQVGLVVAVAVAMVLAAAWLPARRAARMRPVEALADA